MNNTFVKVADLKPEDRKKLKSYWTELWGSEFASALVNDFETTGNKKKVEAKTNTEKK